MRSITLDSEDSYTETITDMPGNDPISLVLSKEQQTDMVLVTQDLKGQSTQ